MPTATTLAASAKPRAPALEWALLVLLATCSRASWPNSVVTSPASTMRRAREVPRMCSLEGVGTKAP
ncbi:hypothetical protein ACEN8K_41715, partial [Variovorax sp. CT11-76]